MCEFLSQHDVTPKFLVSIFNCVGLEMATKKESSNIEENECAEIKNV